MSLLVFTSSSAGTKVFVNPTVPIYRNQTVVLERYKRQQPSEKSKPDDESKKYVTSRKLAHRLAIWRTSVQRILRHDLRLKSYRFLSYCSPMNIRKDE